ncbi:hypothetical protein [Streptomyces sp. NPDC091371]|uniref:hypothetical protein n=1 Tax=Streptomyces sp. NPDC091371 TaxID=3155303 RepID=UPI003432E2E9
MDRKPLVEHVADALARLTGKTTVRCPHSGCSVRIRYRAATPAAAKRLTDLATDHTRH